MFGSLRITLLAGVVATAAASGASGGAVTIELGAPETVLGDQALGLRYFPDCGLAVVRTTPDCRLLVAAGVSSYLLEGPSLGEFTRATKVLDKGRPGEFDNGYAGIGAAVRGAAGELLAFYHAEDQERMPAIGGGVPGFYCRVGLAVSRDEGASFEKLGPVLATRLPKNPQGRSDQGDGEPSAVADPAGEFLYAYYTSHERANGRTVDICLARCRLGEARDPAAWKKWHAGGFTEPGLAGDDSPIVTGGAPDADAAFPQLVYVPALRQFVMTFCVNAWREADEPRRTGIYVAFSEDGVHWPAERVRQIWRVRVTASLGREVAWHPTFVLDGTAGACGWLYYGYSGSWGHEPPAKPHYMVRRRMDIVRGGPGEP